jgi:hypothetical protein
MLTNLMNTIATQILFSALNSDSRVLDGTSFYLDGGLRSAYFAMAACMAFALLLSVFIPKVLRSDQIESGTAVSA